MSYLVYMEDGDTPARVNLVICETEREADAAVEVIKAWLSTWPVEGARRRGIYDPIAKAWAKTCPVPMDIDNLSGLSREQEKDYVDHERVPDWRHA